MRVSGSGSIQKLLRENLRAVKELWPHVTHSQIVALRELSNALRLSVRSGDLLLLNGMWHVTHSGLLRIAKRKRCKGITTELGESVSNPKEGRWVFKATVMRSETDKFVGYGDADPSNVSAMVHGAEMRVAETRAVNRALRKAYGIGICSVEEIGAVAEPSSVSVERRRPPQPANGNGSAGRTVRDRLYQIIRQHQLDPILVKAYATDFCGVKELRDATRDQVQAFVDHLADWAEKDRNALACQLNAYLGQKAGAA
jgi:hypothetical protein